MRRGTSTAALALLVIAFAGGATAQDDGPRRGPPPGGDTARMTDEELSTIPFVGVTNDGEIVPDLFTTAATGVSTDAMRESAAAFIDSLTDAQREEALFDVEALEWRKWSNVDDYAREGVSLGDMSDEQVAAAWTMVDTVLSDQGLEEVRAAVRLNATLGELLDEPERFNEGLYWFTMMGEPDPDAPWGFQIDGHHVAINVFVLGDQLSITPAFLGAEPAVAPEGTSDAGLSVLQAKQDAGLAFAQSLDESQLERATLSPDKVEDDMVAAAFTDNAVMPYEGLAAADMSEAQRAALLELVATYTGDMEDEHAGPWIDLVAEHLDETRFAWIGGVADDAVFYYRVHSPVILIEFDHQSPKPLAQLEEYRTDQPVRYHVHAIVRTPNGNDYGKDWLRRHLAESH